MAKTIAYIASPIMTRAQITHEHPLATECFFVMALFLLRFWLFGPFHALDGFQVVFRHHVFAEQAFDQRLRYV